MGGAADGGSGAEGMEVEVMEFTKEEKAHARNAVARANDSCSFYRHIEGERHEHTAKQERKRIDQVGCE